MPALLIVLRTQTARLKWQHSRSCFHNFTMTSFNELDHKSIEELLQSFFFVVVLVFFGLFPIRELYRNLASLLYQFTCMGDLHYRTKHSCKAVCVGLPARELATSSSACVICVTEPNTPAKLFVSVFQRGNSTNSPMCVICLSEPNTPAGLFVLSVFQQGNSLPAHLYV